MIRLFVWRRGVSWFRTHLHSGGVPGFGLLGEEFTCLLDCQSPSNQISILSTLGPSVLITHLLVLQNLY
jgi:hypothetical protein